MAGFVFVDSRVQGLEGLLLAYPVDARIVVLDPTRDGIEQIAKALEGVSDLDSIHIVSHGASGTLYIGSSVLDVATLSNYETQLKQIGDSLSESGDLLLYGCNVGAGSEGRSFVQQLAHLTGADVAASDDVTGNSALGGDWILEEVTGSIESRLAFTGSAQEAYAFSLATINGTSGNDTLVGTSGNDTFAAGAGNDSLVGGEGDDLLQDSTNNLAGFLGVDTMVGGPGDDWYVVDSASDVVVESAGEGNDTVFAKVNFTIESLPHVENIQVMAASGITITGNAGNNIVAGNNFGSILFGLDGNDTLWGGVVMDGGNGIDLANYANQAGSIYVSLAIVGEQAIGGNPAVQTLANIENVLGGAFHDQITGNAGDNTLDGFFGNDTLNGGGGNDSLIGGFGDDVYLVDASGTDVIVENVDEGWDIVRSQISYSLAALGAIEQLELLGVENLSASGNGLGNVLAGNAGDNVLDGDAGADTASYVYAGAGVAVSLYIVAPQATGGAGTDTLINIENLIGGAFGDTLGGNGGDNLLNGGAGVDTATYAGVEAGVAVSLAIAGAQATGGAGSDTLLNIENLLGGAFNDTLTGNSAVNLLDGSFGNDTLVGGAGNDTLQGGAEIDTAEYSFAVSGVNAQLWLNAASNDGQGGTDTLSGIENLTGGGFNDLLVGDESANTLKGANGADSLIGGGGNDSLAGEDGNDVLRGGTGNDTLNGSTGTDTADYSLVGNGITLEIWKGTVSNDGEGGADTLIGMENAFGTQSNDLLVGTEGANSLFGNLGNDTLTGGGGADSLIGEGGNDVLRGGAGNDTLNGGAETDTADYSTVANGITLEIWKGTVSNDGEGGADTLIGIENAFGTQSNDLLVGTEDANSLFGNTGNDTLTGGGGNDSLIGEGGNDILRGGAGNDTLNGSTGIDTADYSTVGSGITLEIWKGTVSNDGEGGADTLIGIENAFGTAFNDFLVGTEDANGLFGNTGNDSIVGGGGADSLVGEAGNDTLRGGAGNDTLTGNTGQDIYRFDTALAANVDTITDFSVVDDTIQLYSVFFTGISLGGVAGASFISGVGQTTAADADDRVIYNTSTGALYYDADGTGGGSSPVQFATLIGSPALTSADFVVI